MAFQMAWRLLTLVATRTETDRPDPSDAVGHQVGSWERKVKDCEQMAAQQRAARRGRETRGVLRETSSNTSCSCWRVERAERGFFCW